jgi:hypothetical protein
MERGLKINIVAAQHIINSLSSVYDARDLGDICSSPTTPGLLTCAAAGDSYLRLGTIEEIGDS